MSDVDITLACDLNDRTQSIHNGTIRPQGIDLTTLHYDIIGCFWGMSQFKEYDVSEASMATYIVMTAQGNDDFIAIPVFPSRFFRHSSIYVNPDSGIEEPEDLKGRKVGIPEYQQTATLWVRGMLHHDYGVKSSDMNWYQGGLIDPGREHMIDFDLPERISIQAVPDSSLDALLSSGEIDALISAETPPSYPSSSVQRLFSDVRAVEMDYYERTGHFPIMHTIIMKREVYERHKWIARELTDCFTEAKDFALEEMTDTKQLNAVYPWLHTEIPRTVDLMGEDFWPYGVEENRGELEAMTQYAHEQGLTERKVEVEELFPPNTMEKYKH